MGPLTSLILALTILCTVMTPSEGSSCVTKIEEGKLVSEGDCESESGDAVLRDLDVKVKESEGECEFDVGDICYWSYGTEKHAVNFTEAHKICADKGSVLGYFQTEIAYNKTVQSLRARIVAAGITTASAYTGVVIDEQTLSVTQPDTKLYMKWLPGYPIPCKECTSVFLRFDSKPNATGQGMWNRPPSGKLFGVVCQNNLNSLN